MYIFRISRCIEDLDELLDFGYKNYEDLLYRGDGVHEKRLIEIIILSGFDYSARVFLRR